MLPRQCLCPVPHICNTCNWWEGTLDKTDRRGSKVSHVQKLPVVYKQPVRDRRLGRLNPHESQQGLKNVTYSKHTRDGATAWVDLGIIIGFVQAKY